MTLDNILFGIPPLKRLYNVIQVGAIYKPPAPYYSVIAARMKIDARLLTIRIAL